MKPVQPVHRNDTGAKVSKLHQCLLFLILNQPGISDNDRSAKRTCRRGTLIAHKPSISVA